MSLQDLEHRGYQPGGGFISTSGLFYLNIPKNASTFLSNVLQENGWEHYNLNDTQRAITEYVVVLRDPIDRWISGFATYASSWLLGAGYGSDHFVQDYNELTERVIFDNLVFDDHTTPQAEYVGQLSAKPVTYFKLTDRLTKQLSRFTGSDLIVSDVDGNVSENNYDQRQISKLIRQRIDNDPALKAKIIERYKCDFNLISSVQFYYDPR
jgi:hypothetical protein